MSETKVQGKLIEILGKAIEKKGSDIFIVPGSNVMVKVKGQLVPITTDKMMPADVEALINDAYELASRDIKLLYNEGDDDFSFSVRDLSRFRCNTYRQRGSLAATLRIVAFGLPDPNQLGIPQQVLDLCQRRSGMILVTGPAGSGKSTTLACMIDQINSTSPGHIVTIEDPIEFLHRHKQSLISQREVPGDALTFARALRAALRQAPDVIMLGEMRDQDTIRTAITAAETGHLLLSSLHTVGASKTVDRIVDSFPAEQQQQIRVQLSQVLHAVVSQRLVPAKDGTLQTVFEVMIVNPAVQNMIREGRTHQIDNAIVYGNGMLSMDGELQRLVRSGKITREMAMAYAINPETMARKV